jgi:hypothetical protein
MDEDLEKLTKALLQDRSAARIGEQNVLLFGHSTMDQMEAVFTASIWSQKCLTRFVPLLSPTCFIIVHI